MFGTPGRILQVLFMLATRVEEEQVMPIGLLSFVATSMQSTRQKSELVRIMISDSRALNLKRPTLPQRSTKFRRLRPMILVRLLAGADSCIVQ